MTSRERVMTALSHKEPDIVPFSLGFGINHPAKIALSEYMKIADIGELNNLLTSLSDICHVNPRYIGPDTRRIAMPDGSNIDIWGVKRSPVKNDKDTYMEISEYPLSDISDTAELLNYVFPNAEWFDYSVIPEQINAIQKSGRGEYAIMASGGNIFESSWYMRGLENMFVDLLAEKEFAWLLMEKVTDFFIGYTQKILESANGRIDLIFTADDIGSQNDLLVSLPLWEEMIKPHHKRLNKMIHNYGAKVVYHSDGAIMKAVDGLIDMDIDVLEALQFDAEGMDPVKLKEIAGDKLSFHGGVSVQSTLPFGTPDEVESEVTHLIKTLGKNGGYILAPSHAVQAGTPPENIYAFLKATGRLKNNYI